MINWNIVGASIGGCLICVLLVITLAYLHALLRLHLRCPKCGHQYVMFFYTATAIHYGCHRCGYTWYVTYEGGK